MTKYLISDTHFSHKNICGPSISSWSEGFRNFATIEDMENAIVDSINGCVQPDDELLHFGDVFMGQVLLTASRIRGRIKCRNIHLVYGNHDKQIQKTAELQALFATVQHYLEFRYKGILLSCFHYPMHTWNEAGKGGLHAFGHCHGNFNHPSQAVDVGWDVWKKPITVDKFIEFAQAKKYHAVDHHNENTSHSRR